MTMRPYVFLILLSFSFPFLSIAQNSDRISFDLNDSTSGYYLAIQPKSKQIRGAVILLTSFLAPEDLLSETKLHNVAYNNDILTVFAPMKQKLYADSFAVGRINAILKDIVQGFMQILPNLLWPVMMKPAILRFAIRNSLIRILRSFHFNLKLFLALIHL
jgi:hypothetical protein